MFLVVAAPVTSASSDSGTGGSPGFDSRWDQETGRGQPHRAPCGIHRTTFERPKESCGDNPDNLGEAEVRRGPPCGARRPGRTAPKGCSRQSNPAAAGIAALEGAKQGRKRKRWNLPAGQQHLAPRPSPPLWAAAPWC